MKKNIGKTAIKVIMVLLILGLVGRAVYVLSGAQSGHLPENTVAELSITGIIYDADSVIESLEELSKNEKVKGIIIRVNSPGGVITPTKEIFDYIQTINKPVYASMESVAASGGYYVSAACDRIFAMPTTITGSIGVIMQLSNYEKLMNTIGIKNFSLKSGEFKDIGSPDREMTEAEKQILMTTVMDMYEQFIEDIQKRRNMDEAVLRAQADGRVFTGKRAFDMGFVDNLGSRRDAFEEMKNELKLENVELRNFDKKISVWDKFFGRVEGLNLAGGAHFMYLYKGY
ncbi:signal peptide peptidase SppA [Geovibrio ferrireducens]|uniref:signal peptide peptidase SppA n=1 Tax=Geovibrio ferrireducens TaxID=46201 RepID=UPI0022480936|nr:signal peptide peptidase SppA [Geovibrio ferrireducens]